MISKGMRLLRVASNFHCAFIFILIFPHSLIVNGQKFGFYIEEDKNKVTFPFELYNNLIVIPVSINEQDELKFILDTGVRNCIVINKEFSGILGLKHQRSIQLLGVGGKSSVHASVTDPVSIGLPGLASNGISVLVLENDFLDFDRYLGTKIDGLIGYDLFRRFVVKINYNKKRITFFEPKHFKLKGKYESLHLDIVESKPLINASLQIDSSVMVAVKLLVDTGASHALILNQKSDEKIVIPEKRIKAKLGRGLSGEIDGYLGRIDRLVLGSKNIEKVISSFPD